VSYPNYLKSQLPTYVQVAGHVEDEHLCSAPVHMCGKVRYEAMTMCLRYLHAMWLAVRPQGDKPTWGENVFLPGEL
jgi:hypothetical protein